MNRTMAIIGLNGKRAQMKDNDVNGLSVRGGHNYYILIRVGY